MKSLNDLKKSSTHDDWAGTKKYRDPNHATEHPFVGGLKSMGYEYSHSQPTSEHNAASFNMAQKLREGAQAHFGPDAKLREIHDSPVHVYKKTGHPDVSVSKGIFGKRWKAEMQYHEQAKAILTDPNKLPKRAKELSESPAFKGYAERMKAKKP